MLVLYSANPDISPIIVYDGLATPTYVNLDLDKSTLSEIIWKQIIAMYHRGVKTRSEDLEQYLVGTDLLCYMLLMAGVDKRKSRFTSWPNYSIITEIINKIGKENIGLNHPLPPIVEKFFNSLPL